MPKPTPYKAWLRKFRGSPVWPQAAVVVSITWDDATQAHDVEDSGLARAVTLGIILEATSEYVKTASEFFHDKTVRDVSTIPAGMVVEIQTIARSDLP